MSKLGSLASASTIFPLQKTLLNEMVFGDEQNDRAK